MPNCHCIFLFVDFKKADFSFSADLFTSIADVMVSDGYLDAGYEFVIIDDCWLANDRDGSGQLQADPERFPEGIKGVADYVSPISDHVDDTLWVTSVIISFLAFHTGSFLRSETRNL